MDRPEDRGLRFRVPSPNVARVLLAIMGVLGCLAWVGILSTQLAGLLRAARLADLHPPEPGQWPMLSIVVPACNEAETIEPAMRTLLAADYEPLEIIAVDDRSSDATGEILDRIAVTDPKLRVIHLRELPEGWLGKVNAMRAGFDVSRGPLVLFADADVHFSPSLLRKAVAIAEARELEHLTMLPRFRSANLGIGMLMAAFFDGYLSRVRTSRPEVKMDGPPFGFGAFNLVRRSAFEATEGFAWFKLDILDDLALGAMMQKRGRSAFLVAAGEFSLEFYSSVGAAIRGWEKNFPGALAGYSVPKLVAMGIGTAFMPLAPLAVVVQGVSLPLRWLPLFPLLLLVLAAVAGRLRHDRPAVHALLQPMSFFVSAFGMVRAAVLLQRRGGIAWRGTFYPRDRLREGGRVRFP